MKYKYIFLFCTIMILSISAVSAADNTTEDIQIEDTTGDLTDLQKLINEETNDTIDLRNDYVGDSNNETVITNVALDYVIDAFSYSLLDKGNADLTELQNLIDNDKTGFIALKTDFFGDANNKTVVINKNITIDGNGFNVDYLSNLPIFDIQASNVTIINMTIYRHRATMGDENDIFTHPPATSDICYVHVIDKIYMQTILGNDITKIYKNDTQYYVTIFDLNNQTLANTTVTFYVNNVYYKHTSDSNGRAKLNINLLPGEYTIIAENTNTTQTIVNTIVVLPNIVENNDLEKYFHNNSQYVVKILNDDGTPAKANETVIFNINGVFYNRTTNETGHAKLNINLNPGEYIITAEYKGCKVSNKIKVKSILSADDLSKKYGTPDQFKAKLVDGEGNPLANTNVTFNINGVFYNRTTDSDGIAKLNVRLMPGEYIITSSYNECYISNKITVTA